MFLLRIQGAPVAAARGMGNPVLPGSLSLLGTLVRRNDLERLRTEVLRCLPSCGASWHHCSALELFHASSSLLWTPQVSAQQGGGSGLGMCSWYSQAGGGHIPTQLQDDPLVPRHGQVGSETPENRMGIPSTQGGGLSCRVPRGVPRERGAEGSPDRRLSGAGSGPAGSGTRPGSLSCPFTVTLQNRGAAAVTMTMAGPGGSRGARLGAALLGAERRARLSRTEEGQGRPAATAMAEAEDRSIHTQHISAVHNVPMRVLIRPIPAELEPGKVQSLMETLQVSTAPGMQRQPLLHPLRGHCWGS